MFADDMFADDIVSSVHSHYASLDYKPTEGHYTILAAFILSLGCNHKVCSIGTGSKVLPTSRYSLRGDSLHDSHAEVVARRGFMYWLYEELSRICGGDAYQSVWIHKRESRFELRQGVLVHLYVSTVPCGDASTRFLASFQDEAVATLKDSVDRPVVPMSIAARGRDNYSLYGVLRTKPGRADSPPTMCMSCSDKIAKWCLLGIQGALLSRFITEPLGLDEIILGEVDESARSVVKGDCERAFHGRLSWFSDKKAPAIRFTSVPFIHSRSALGGGSPANESLCWIADFTLTYQVLINGLKRGTSPKHRYHPKYQPLLCKVSLFTQYDRLLQLMNIPLTSSNIYPSYYSTKQLIANYRARKELLMGVGCPFEGWLHSGEQWENFGRNGEYLGNIDV